MPKTPQINVDTLRNEAVRPLYVVAGATDLAVEIARGYVSEAQVKVTGAQKKATRRVQAVDFEPKALQSRALELVNARVDELTKQAKALPGKVEAYVDDTVTDLNDTYAELAVRGQKLVTKLRKQQASQDLKAAGRTTTAKAKATRTSAKKGAASTRTSAKAAATSAKKAAAPAKSRAKATRTTATKGAASTRSNAKATGTAAQKTAQQAVQAVSDGAGKVGA
jgi:hypothetical protein